MITEPNMGDAMELVSDETIAGIDDETLKRIVNAGDMWWGDPGIQSMAAELLQLRAEKQRLLESLQWWQNRAEQIGTQAVGDMY